MAFSEEEKQKAKLLAEGAANGSKIEFNQSVLGASTADPERHAKDLQLSKQFDLPADVVKDNRDDLEQKQKINVFQWEAMKKSNPAMLKYLKDADNAKISLDDVEHLNWFEKQWIDGKNDWARNKLMVEQAGIGRKGMSVGMNSADVERVKAIRQEMGAEPDYDTVTGTIANTIPLMMDTFKRAATEEVEYVYAGAGAGAGVGFAAGNATGVGIAAPEELLTVPAGALTGAGIGMQSAFAAASSKTHFGLMYADLIADGVDADIAYNTGQVVGAVNGLIEVVNAGPVLKNIPILRNFTSSGIRSMMSHPTKAAAMGAFGKNIALAAGGEGVEEYLQTHVEALGKEYAKLEQSGEFSELSSSEIMDKAIDTMALTHPEAAHAFKEAMIAGTAFGIAGGGMTLRGDLKDASQAEKTSAFFKEIGQKVNDSKTFQRLPEKFQEAIKNIKEEHGVVEDVYLDAESMQTFFQSNPDAYEAFNESMPKYAQQMREQAQFNGDVVIPIEEYATQIAPTEMGQHFADDVRLSPYALSAREEKLEAANVDNIKVEEQAESKKYVTDDVFGMAMQATGSRKEAQEIATLWGGAINTLADTQGIDAKELYDQYKLTIKRKLNIALTERENLDMNLTPLLSRLRAGDYPKDVEIYGESLVESLRAAGGIIDSDGGELAARDADDNLKPFQKKLIQEGGRTLDDAAEYAFERGYIPVRDVNLLIDAIDNELRGNPVYSNEDIDADKESLKRSLEQVEEELSRRGLDMEKLSDKEIIEELGKDLFPDDGDILNQAKDSGYEGENIGEAKEWLRAKAKGLDMSKEARMERAKAMGFDVDTVMYRGLPEPYSADKVGHLIWTTPDTKYAGAYAYGGADKSNTDAGSNVMPVLIRSAAPFDFNFRSQFTEIKFGDMLDRVRKGLGPALKEGRLSKEAGLDLIDAIEDLRDSESSNEFKPVFRWWNTKPEVIGILKAMGHDSITAMEGGKDDVPTTALFDSSQIRSINAAFDPDYADSGNLLAQPAYHGSPHKFDKFSLEAMGTGEGAQAYGWGMYFAGDKAVADWYREELSDSVEQYKLNGVTYERGTPEWKAIATIQNDGMESAQELYEMYKADLENNEQYIVHMGGEDFVSKYKSTMESYDENNVEEVAGNLYQVDIPEDSELLDYDKRLSDQSDFIKSAIEKGGEFFQPTQEKWFSWDMTGEQFYKDLAKDRDAIKGLEETRNDKEASLLLGDVFGIKGLRFLDGNSRNKGEASHNYVIWDESVVTIESVNDELAAAEAEESTSLFQSQPQEMPDRWDILRAFKGFDGLSFEGDVLPYLSEAIGTNDKLHDASNLSSAKIKQKNIDAINKIDDIVAVYSAVERLTYAWDKQGNVYQIIDGKTTKLDDEQAQNYSANILSKVFSDLNETNPEYVQAQAERAAEGDEIRRRQNRLSNIPAMPSDFNEALSELAQWAENFDEFKAALNPDMFDLSDRNLTRLGRATMALDDEYKSLKNPATIFRAMPEGESIEAGDWVSLEEEYASMHESNVDDGGAVTESFEAGAGEVFWPEADEHEWVYIPDGTWGDYETLEEVWADLGGNKPMEYPQVNGKTLYQSESEVDESLVAVHNLSESNLLHAEKMGGLAVPSLAITDTNKGDFDGFGEITLIADKSLIDPKNKDTRAFGADVYSPRYPELTYKADKDEATKITERLDREISNINSFQNIMDNIESNGLDYLYNDDGVRALFLEESGTPVKKVYRKPETKFTAAQKKKWGGKTNWQLMDDKAFNDFAAKHYRKKIDSYSADIQEIIEDRYFNEEGVLHNTRLTELARLAADSNRKPRLDSHVMRERIEKKLKSKSMKAKYDEWFNDLTADLITKESIYEGRNYSGSKKTKPHTLENVVNKLKKDLVAGENFNYGAGNIRAAATREFKSIDQIKNNKDKLVDEATFNEAKKQIEIRLDEITDKLRAHYKYSKSSFGSLEASEYLTNVGKRGMTALNADFENIDSSVKELITDFMNDLAIMPTEYFEVNLTRAVDFGEFSMAVVPSDISPAALKVLKDSGLTIRRYDDKGAGRSRSEVIAKQKKLLFQSKDGKTEPRGQLQITKDRLFNITLNESADRSTLLHESAHAFFEILEDIASLPDANERAKAMRTDLVKWYKSNAEAVAKEATAVNKSNHPTSKKVFTADDVIKHLESKEGKRLIGKDAISTALHEQFARGFEAYLFEGKAPSVEMRNVFYAFKRWLLNVYKIMKRLNVNLTDDVRSVFDRLLATDAEIAEARDFMEAGPMFTDEVSSAMSPEVYKRYKALVVEAKEQGESELSKKVLTDLQREAKAWWQEEHAKLSEEIAEELNQNPTYAAWAFFRYGKKPDGTELPEGTIAQKLDKAPLLERYGQKFLTDNIRRTGIYSAKEGLHFEEMARQFGFDSGDAMIQAIMAAPKQKEFIKAEADHRMQQRHPDIFSDLAEEAIQAIHSDKQGELLAFELEQLARRAGSRVSPNKMLKESAQRRIGTTELRGIRPHVYRRAEQKAGKAALIAAAKGDKETALREKQKQLFNFHLAREAQKAIEQADKLLAHTKKLSTSASQKRIGKAGADYLEQINAILERYEFKKVPFKQLLRRESLQNWVNSFDDADVSPDISDEMQSQIEMVNYRTLTPEQLEDIADTLGQIEHLARTKNKLLNAQEKRDLAELADDIEKSIEENFKGKKVGRDHDSHNSSGIKSPLRWTKGFLAEHRKIASLVKMMDGKENGVMWNALIKPLNAAADIETERMTEAGEIFDGLYSVYSATEKRGFYKGTFYPELGKSMTKDNLLAMALNWGNADNKKKLLAGYGWSEAQVQAVLMRELDKRDWEFVQSLWNFVNTYWPEIEAQEKSINGVAPDKVEATSFLTPYGQFNGGYFPLKYDGNQDVTASAHAAKDAANEIMKGKFSKGGTKKGYTKDRVKGVTQRVTLDSSMAFGHITDLLHDLTHRKPLIDAKRIINNKTVSDAIIEHYGKDVWNQLDAAITVIGAGDVPVRDRFEAGLSYLRNGVTIAGLGWRLSTAAIQPLGLTQSVVVVGAKWIGVGVKNYIAHPFETTADVLSKSSFMRSRSTTQSLELRDVRKKVHRAGTLKGVIDEWVAKSTHGKVDFEAIEETYFYFITKMQQTVDMPTWLGAYEKAQSQGLAEEQSIALADQAVIDSQGSGYLKDLSVAQNGGAFKKLFTNFMSYFNVTMNLTAESYRRTDFKSPKDLGKFAVDILLLHTIPAVLPMLIGKAIWPEGDDDDKGLFEEMVRAQLSYTSASLLGLREFSGVFAGYNGYSGPAGLRFFSDAGKLAKQLEQGEADVGLAKAAMNTASVVFHLPLPATMKQLEGAHALFTGETNNPLAIINGAPR